MRNILIVSSIILTMLFVLVKSGIVDALVVFLLSGSLPGTPFVLSPSMMMACLITTAWLAIMRITNFDFKQSITMRRLVKRHTSKQNRMPKRRYSRI